VRKDFRELWVGQKGRWMGMGLGLQRWEMVEWMAGTCGQNAGRTNKTRKIAATLSPFGRCRFFHVCLRFSSRFFFRAVYYACLFAHCVYAMWFPLKPWLTTFFSRWRWQLKQIERQQQKQAAFCGLCKNKRKRKWKRGVENLQQQQTEETAGIQSKAQFSSSSGIRSVISSR